MVWVAANDPSRLFIKNLGPCKPVRGSIWADAWPVSEGQTLWRKLESQALMHAGSNYNCPMVEEFTLRNQRFSCHSKTWLNAGKSGVLSATFVL